MHRKDEGFTVMWSVLDDGYFTHSRQMLNGYYGETTRACLITLHSKEMSAGLGFTVQAILGMMGSQSLLYVGALSVRLSEGFLVLIAVCSE